MAQLDFSLPEGEFKRQAYRVFVPGLEVKLEGSERTYPAKDLSASGISFQADPGFRGDKDYVGSLLLNGKSYLDGVKLRIMKVLDENVIACKFLELSFTQETKLDKLVLEVQKILIARKKAGK